MRKDMEKVIVEQERYDGGGQRRMSRNSGRGRAKFRADKDPDNYVGPETKRKLVYKYSYKSFNDHLTPLYRYLKRNVGRPWNKVYSEISESADSRSTTGHHLRDHVKQYVCTDIEAAEERVAALKAGERWFHSFRVFSAAFYVDRKGFLRKFPERAVKRGPADPPPYYIDATNEKLRYVMISGAWHVEDHSQVRTRTERNSYGDYFEVREVMTYALSSKEITRLGLRDLPVKDLKAA